MEEHGVSGSCNCMDHKILMNLHDNMECLSSLLVHFWPLVCSLW